MAMSRTVTVAAGGGVVAVLMAGVWATAKSDEILSWAWVCRRWLVKGQWNGWKIAAILFALMNLKVLPFAWHLRVLNAFLEHLFLHPQPPPPTQALFQPLITTSRCAAFECDYNLHKSNSSYFSDLDVTRTHLLTCLFGRGMKTGGKNARVLIILGATHCSFKREIKPYQPYEMWSRVLCWDQKWLYVVTHFVRLGAVKPAGYTLARGGWWFWRTKQSSSASSRPAEKDVIPEKAILAVAISKYVFKQGRRTLPPETFLADCALLPPPHPLASPASPDDDNDGWTRDHVEAERIKGLRFAERFAYLDALGDTFTGADGPALGRFGDLLPGAV